MKRRSTVGAQAKDGQVDKQPDDTLDPEKPSNLMESTVVADLLKPKKYNDKPETSDLNTFYKNDETNSGLGHGAAFEVLEQPK